MHFDKEGHPIVDSEVTPETEIPTNMPPGFETIGLTLDDLFHFEVDREEVERAQKELLLPEGTYTTTPPPKVSVGIDKTGRKYARFFVPVALGNNHGSIGYRISWERKNKRDPETQEDTGKPDLAYRLYLQADRAYEKAIGSQAENPGQVVKYLSDYPHRVRITQFTGENMVVAISPVFES